MLYALSLLPVLHSLFFTACDGIFLNYTWSDLTLANSSQRAGTRRYDVFVGIDVFGRGCPGGGGFNSKEVVLALVLQHICHKTDVCMC